MTVSVDTSKELLQDINNRVKQVRKDKGLTMAEFAKRIGVSSGNVGDWESKSKRSSPSAIALHAIASEFDVSLDWLIMGKPMDKELYVQSTGRMERVNDSNESELYIAERNSNFFVESREKTSHSSSVVTSNYDEMFRELLTNASDLPAEDITLLNNFAVRLLQATPKQQNTDKNKKRPLFENKGLTIREKNLPEHYYVKLPLLGQVPAGDPIAAIEHVDERIDVPADLVNDTGTYFVLRVKGNSMINVNIHDGNLVIVRQQPDAENGEIVVAMTNNEDVTVKTFYRENGHVRLQPENDEMQPIIAHDIKILGKVIAVYRRAQD